MRNYHYWEVGDLVLEKFGLGLDPVGTTSVLSIADGSTHRNKLVGPFVDPANRDVRIFVNYRELGVQGGVVATHVSISLLVQDCDDDVFLNSKAAGAEKYDVGIARWVE